MQPAEVVWRARSAAMKPIDWARWKRNPAVPEASWTVLRSDSYPVKLHDKGAPIEHVYVFDLEFPVGFEFDWHRDYRYDRQIESRFVRTLNIRDTTVVSDIKYVWEPSRHQHLSALAFAANATQNAGYIVHSLDSWLEANPYLCGVNWSSSLELAERIVSWALLYPRIADRVAQNQHFRNRWLASIYLHMAHIAQNLSLFSSANNHLIGELVGLFVGSSCFDFWPRCNAWRNLAQRLLEREIRVQVGEDGVNREQAISYHTFTLELLLLAFIIGRNTNHLFSSAYAERLRGMVSFLDAVATSCGDLPSYGDSDDARGFLVSQGETALEVTMQLAGLLFAEPSWFRLRKTHTAAAQALLPDLLPKLNHQTHAAASPRHLFPDAGLACVPTYDGSIRLLMDFGPLGFKKTASHGHADALSIWLSIDDEYFLIDAGTYAYHSHPEWRAFFRSTAAHNTASVDGRNQSEMAGRFLWSAKATARLLRFDDSSGAITIEAEHDGYERLPEPVTHRRTVHFWRTNGHLSIDDNFRCCGRHDIELFFHMHEDAAILSVHNGAVEVGWRQHRVLFSSPDHDACWEIFSGSDNPKLGWRSRHFNRKQPISTLRIRKTIHGSSTMRTNLRIHP